MAPPLLPTTPALLTAQQVADFLGFSRPTVYSPDFQRRLRLTPIRLGRSLRFKRAEVERLLGDQPAVGEIGDLRGWAERNGIPWPQEPA